MDSVALLAEGESVCIDVCMFIWQHLSMYFEWDYNKDAQNQEKHNVSFELAKRAFFDEERIISEDVKHSTHAEIRYYCFGRVDGRILTVRFTMRKEKIRIFGAAYWREGASKYEKANGL